MVRSYAPNKAQGALYAAAVGIVGFVDVPIVYYSVIWWRSIHPSPVVGPQAQAGALEPVMLWILLFSFLTFLVLYRFLPNTEVRFNDVWLGALLAALAFEGAKWAFVWYVGSFAHYNVVYGSVGAILALLTWVYL